MPLCEKCQIDHPIKHDALTGEISLVPCLGALAAKLDALAVRLDRSGLPTLEQLDAHDAERAAAAKPPPLEPSPVSLPEAPATPATPVEG